MTGSEPIRFGLMGFGKNYKVDVRNFDRFAKEGITLDELKEVVGKENIKNMPLFEKMFASIAKDDLLDTNELFGYFKQLDKAAELNEKNYMLSDNDLISTTGEELGDILQANELVQMEKARGHVGKKPDAAQTETMHQFVDALIKVNDEKVQVEMQKEAEIAEQKAAEEAELASRTTIDPKTGNVTVVDKDNPKNSETRDRDGKLVKRTFEDGFYWNEITHSEGIDDAMVTEEYNGEEKVFRRTVKGTQYGGVKITLIENINPATGNTRSDKTIIKDSEGKTTTEEKNYANRPVTVPVTYTYEDEKTGELKKETTKKTFTPYNSVTKDEQGRIIRKEELTSDYISKRTRYKYNDNNGTMMEIFKIIDEKESSRLLEARDYQTDANGKPLFETIYSDKPGNKDITKYYRDGEVYLSSNGNGKSAEYFYKDEKIDNREYNRLVAQLIRYYENIGIEIQEY